MRRTKEKRALVANRQLPKVLVFALDSEQPKKKFPRCARQRNLDFPKIAQKSRYFAAPAAELVSFDVFKKRKVSLSVYFLRFCVLEEYARVNRHSSVNLTMG